MALVLVLAERAADDAEGGHVEHRFLFTVIFEQVDQYRKKGSLISSNTSGIPIESMIEKRSEDFQAHFFGSHFFNPARYLNLLEIIPTSFTKKEIIDFMIINIFWECKSFIE